MKYLAVAVNASYSHTNLTLRYLTALAERYADVHIELLECNINTRDIVSEIYRKQPDVILFSCYIWNVELVRDIINDYRKIDKSVRIVIGGPEADGGFIGCDVITGGETEFLSYLNIDKDITMDDLPFPYPDLHALTERTLYYESSRGCPFNCAYCLSSGSSGVQNRSLTLVFNDLDLFLGTNVRRVKFVDRTFNADISRAMSIWRYLSGHDNGITNFHFEISASLLTDGAISFLSGVRNNLFQFEIGVQSTNPETLRAINRRDDFGRIKDAVKRLMDAGNIHVHLDLIAGLPHETYEIFKNSFNDVYSLTPHQIQLGFLKVLRGSAFDYPVEYQNKAPYEILCSGDITFGQLSVLKGICYLVEKYYNSGRFTETLKYLTKDPFDFYEQFYFYLQNLQDILSRNIGKYEFFDLLYRFVQTSDKSDIVPSLLKYDLLSFERPRSVPGFLGNIKKTGKDEYKAGFPFDIEHFITTGMVVRHDTTVYFHYKDYKGNSFNTKSKMI